MVPGAAMPTYDEYVRDFAGLEPSGESLPFDRMMFDVCGEANHVRAAARKGDGTVSAALRGFDRACARVYSDARVSQQRKFSLRTAEWLLKAWCLWGAEGVSERSATRWFDAWQHERNMSLLEL